MTQPHTVKVVYRLSPEVYNKIVAQLPKAAVGPNTTELMCASLVGQEQVLRLLREGVVIEEPNA